MIKKWVLKAIVQKAISYLPSSHRLNFFFQKYITRGVQLTDEYFEDRLIHAKKHIDSFDRYASRNLNTTLELGTGWYPVVPISLFLRGAEQINTVDISSLTSKENVLTTIRFFIDYQKKGKLQPFLKVSDERFGVLETLNNESEDFDFQDVIKKLKINCKIGDIRNLQLASQSIDLIHSNNTFEHVYPEVLRGILEKFKSFSSKGGIMSHFIDMSDHFAHFDKSINIYNFLRFSDLAWGIIDNSVQPQNRWRCSDYEKLYNALSIDISERDCRKGNVDEVLSINLNKKFKDYDLKDLAVSHCYLISKM